MERTLGGRLAGQPASRLHLSAWGLLVQCTEGLSLSPDVRPIRGAGSKGRCPHTLIHFLQLGSTIDLEQYLCKASVNPCMLGPISVMVEKKPGGLFL